MELQGLQSTARSLVGNGKGLLAIDESTATCDKRFAEEGIPQTIEERHAYREWIVSTPKLSESISGVILFDETIRQRTAVSKSFVDLVTEKGMVVGVKVDMGAMDLAGHAGEKLTSGLDGLRERLAEYGGMGARFAKWRAVFTIGDGLPSRACIEANAQVLALYAGLCQEAGLVPIVEPEVLMDGDHTLQTCATVTENVLLTVFGCLHTQGIALEGMILKPNMILPGLNCKKQSTLEEVAEATVSCLKRAVPELVSGVAFLSGGQSSMAATARLNTMNFRFRSDLPWPLVFSFARAIQQPALGIWKGLEVNIPSAQSALNHRAACNREALHGNYTAHLENPLEASAALST